MPYRDPPFQTRSPWYSRFEDNLKDYQWYRKKIGGPWVRLRIYGGLSPSILWWQRGTYTDPEYNGDYPFNAAYKFAEENWP